MDFSIFKNKYKISGNLEVITALHIGSGVEENGLDAPFITIDGDSKKKNFYIPGSSFRGYLSTKLERLLAKENGFKFVDKKTGEELNEADVKLIFGYTNLQNEKNSVKNRVLEKLGYNKNDVEDKEENYYSMAGRIHISDMLIISDVDSIKRDGIKIDRETGATKDGAKFDYNVIPLGAKFDFNMELENIEEYQLDLIKLALKDILDEDLFGGKLSRGIGKCKLNIDKIEYVKDDNKKDIENYIFKNEMKTKDVKEFFEIKNLELK
ncbi:RAMP superfamily CRISPR-associated protein [Fusobacterium animalis]|uniref:CRISPR type III-associated protein domain-containing protein n=1 Tax=Fusobacterium animalis TaxID=76859 RepID=A0A2B7YU59_9FUSO|nr:RAMP superfamily CRISPR-associated protein [Fusobacterium animalis]PGH24523.1 hypothetical protein RN90_03270 [Fusobacterium animalis]QYR63710.1 hypothetical protein JY398_00670 [Fusobacterium animalis]